MPDAEREPPIRLPNISMLVNLTVESLPLLGVANHTGWLQNDRFHVSNPSIIALPARARLGGAYYVVSLRLSNHNNCFRVMQRTPTPCITLLAFRLLSKFLAPLPHREAVVHWHGAWQCGRTPFEDCRLSASHGTIRLLCKTVVQRIEFELDESSVSSPRFIDHCDSPLICRNPDPSSSTIPAPPPPPPPGKRGSPFDFIRSTPMVTVLRRGLHVRLKGERHVFATLHGSKNMNLFRGGALHKSDAAGGESHEYLERWALGPIYPPQPNASGKTGAGLPLRGQTRRLHEVISLDLTSGRLGERNLTVEPPSLFGKPYPDRWPHGPRVPATPHGGACCHRFKFRPQNSEHDGAAINLGVLHYKLARYQYVQQLYAFGVDPPFPVVAISEPFCWADEKGALTRDTKLFRRGRRYPCPYIQMTMSIAPLLAARPPDDSAASRTRSTAAVHLGDEGAVFAVGMNDCWARLIVVKSLQKLVDEVHMMVHTW